MRTAARDASTLAAAALRSGFRSTASATSALSSGSPKLRIQFGTTAPLRCGPAQLPGIFARADSGMMSAPKGGFFRAQPASTSSEENVFILPLCEESHCDALFGRRHWHGVGEVAVDRQLALCRRPKDGIDLALDDAARIHLHKDFRFIAGFDVAQFVLP